LTGEDIFAQRMLYYNNSIIYTMYTITFKLMSSLQLKKFDQQPEEEKHNSAFESMG